VVEINGVEWTLTGKILDKIRDRDGQEVLPVDEMVLRWLEKENRDREDHLKIIITLKKDDSSLSNDPVLLRWERESQPFPAPWPLEGDNLPLVYLPSDPAWFKDLMALAGSRKVRVPNLYGYDRAYKKNPLPAKAPCTVLDPTAGGGSIPFEALRLGHRVIANELNPVASVILHATLEYPSKFGLDLSSEIQLWGAQLLDLLNEKMNPFFPSRHPLPSSEMQVLRGHIKHCPETEPLFNHEDTTSYLYCRQVTCPNCGGNVPLLNSCWLSKVAGDQWGVKIIPDSRQQNGDVRFETYRVVKGKGPAGEDPDFATVNRGIGTCIHCRQAIDSEEIKAQARGESPRGKWQDRLYCVVAVRYQPKLDKKGQPQRFKSGAKKDEIKTEKIRFFRPPNPADLEAIQAAENHLQEKWDHWDGQGLIPTEKFPQGNDMRPSIYGMPRWCDMFTPRQLLGHLSLVEELNRLKPQILSELGEDKGKAVVTYLQFAIDKGVDFNSRQTLWIPQRLVIGHTFSRHDYSVKWTFAEMILSGPHSGFAWCLSQINDAYTGIAKLIGKDTSENPVQVQCGTGAYMPSIPNGSVDLVCMDPPYYNNVQYAELSDFFYVWQKRTLLDLYPDYFRRRLSDKQNEAVANPDRDGGTKKAHLAYEKMMTDIFNECRRVINPLGMMTLMFTHKSQEAWEVLTKSIIESGWIISSSFPIESEAAKTIHLNEKASAVSSVFISCRKRSAQSTEPALWTGFGGTGVQQRIQQAVEQGLKEFEALKLNPVDEMVASYGRALRVLSEQWPVIDGDEEVGPIRAMNEASRVVSENQIRKVTNGRLKVADLSPEAAMAVTLFGIYRLADIAYDEVLNLSRSLNIAVENKTGGYVPDGRFIGYNTQTAASARIAKAGEEETGFHAPLVRKGSKLRLARPEERHTRRLEIPRTEWDVLCGLIMAYRQGDIPVTRAYLDRHSEGRQSLITDLLGVWAAEIPDDTLKKEARAILFGLKQ
jgi:adenine-specific DNA methylase